MSTARLDVWVTAVGDACRIDDERPWFVHVLHCDGSILEWCGRRYSNVETKCGHVEIEVPPGCYMVCATWSPAPDDATPRSLGNHISHVVAVRANCGDHVCVTLFPPTFHFCGIWWIVALRDHVQMGLVDQDVAAGAIEAVERVLEATEGVEADPMTKTLLEAQRGK
jgi:hypothetical protein